VHFENFLDWFSFLFSFKDFIHLRERPRDRAQGGGGAQGEGESDSPLRVEPNLGLDPRTLRSRPEPKAYAPD